MPNGRRSLCCSAGTGLNVDMVLAILAADAARLSAVLRCRSIREAVHVVSLNDLYFIHVYSVDYCACYTAPDPPDPSRVGILS
jgi:hypothetical protein